MKTLQWVLEVLRMSVTDLASRTVCEAAARVLDDMRMEPGWVLLGQLLLRHSRTAEPERVRVLLVLVALVVAEQQGDAGMDLHEGRLEDWIRLIREVSGDKSLDASAVLNTFLSLFHSGALKGCVSCAPEEDHAPLVLCQNRLQFRRTRDMETNLARMMESRLSALPAQSGTDPFFGLQSGLDDSQKDVIRGVHGQKCVFITGGPGTGKTTCIYGLIQTIFALNPDQAPQRVAVAAPTGKAVFRVRESLQKMSSFQRCKADEVIGAGRLEPVTLHRLLEYSPTSGRFYRHDKAPLDMDWVIVDESSMVDLQLAEALLSALPEEATLVWIGDREQLPSVGLGAVFSTYWEKGPARFPGCFFRLEKNYRAGSVLSRELAGLMRDPARFGWSVGNQEREEGLVLHPVMDAEDFSRFLDGVFDRHFGMDYWESARRELPLDLEETVVRDSALVDFLEGICRRASAHPVLCATHAGRFGTRMVNGFFHRRAGGSDARFVPGEPVMMTVNDYSRQLWNGDFGVVFSAVHRGSSSMGVCFFQEGQVRVFPLVNLPVERAFAFSVHKSQGSEFDSLSFVPGQAPSMLLTRELVYTALTRARKTVHVAGSARDVEQALGRRTTRQMNLENI